MAKWTDLPLRQGDIQRTGRGHNQARLAPLSWGSLLFWGLVARRAMALGRNVVVTGSAESGANVVLAFLKGKALGPSDGESAVKGGYAPSFEEIQGDGPLKIVGPRSFDAHAFRSIMLHMGEKGRPFALASVSRHSDWLRRELDVYAGASNARGIFWLTLK